MERLGFKYKIIRNAARPGCTITSVSISSTKNQTHTNVSMTDKSFMASKSQWDGHPMPFRPMTIAS